MYAATFVFINKETLDKIEALLFDMIWKNKKHHLKKATLMASIDNGGLKMPDIKSMLKSIEISTIKRFSLQNSFASKTAKYILQIDNLEDLLQYKNDTKYTNIKSDFYNQLLDMWYSIHSLTH